MPVVRAAAADRRHSTVDRLYDKLVCSFFLPSPRCPHQADKYVTCCFRCRSAFLHTSVKVHTTFINPSQYPLFICCHPFSPTNHLLIENHRSFITSDKGRGTCFCPCSFVCLSVCLLDEMLRVDRCRDMDELINF